MNNYFGIGLDAKVAMDFGAFRDKNPEKCRSRMKNQMWYGVLGTKEMINQTCKNLHNRLILECDGKEIPLPKLQVRPGVVSEIGLNVSSCCHDVLCVPVLVYRTQLVLAYPP